jgi:hypothetical protein
MTVSQDDQRVERVQLETDRLRIIGDVALPGEGYQSRLSDTLNRPEIAFIPLIDAELSPLAGGEVERRQFVLVAKAHVRVAFPLA